MINREEYANNEVVNLTQYAIFNLSNNSISFYTKPNYFAWRTKNLKNYVFANPFVIMDPEIIQVMVEDCFSGILGVRTNGSIYFMSNRFRVLPRRHLNNPENQYILDRYGKKHRIKIQYGSDHMKKGIELALNRMLNLHFDFDQVTVFPSKAESQQTNTRSSSHPPIKNVKHNKCA